MDNRSDLHPAEVLVLLTLALCWAVATVLRLIVVPLLAVALVACGWRPAPAPRPAPEPAQPALADLKVAELRRLARAAGLPRSLSRSGRRADLLLALA